MIWKFCRLLAVISFSNSAGLIVGCASIEGFPHDPEDSATTLTALSPFFDGSEEAKYTQTDNPAIRQQLRDSIVLGRVRAYDIEFDAFERQLYGSGNAITTGSDLIVLILSGLAATTGDAGTKAALAAASAGVVGAKGIINKDLYYQRTIPALLAQMEANRERAKLVILQGLSRSDAEYSLWIAYLDLDTLKNSGSIPGAIANITQDAGNAKEAAQSAITFMRSSSYFAHLPDIQEIGSRIDRLSPEQLVALARAMEPHLATRPPQIQQLVHGLDPTDVRLTGNPVRAKRVLTAWLNEEEMTPAIRGEWAAALDQVSGAPPASAAVRPRIPAPAPPPATAPEPLLPPASQSVAPAAPRAPPSAVTPRAPVFGGPLPPDIRNRKSALIQAVRQVSNTAQQDPTAKAKLDSLSTVLGLDIARTSTINGERNGIITTINNLVSNPSVAKQQMDDISAKVSGILDHQF